MDEGARFEGNRLCGRVDFDNFTTIVAAGQSLVEAADAGGAAEIDLSGLRHYSSIAVSAMVAWYRQAYGLGKRVNFANVPEDLRKIIAVSGMTELLLEPEPA